MVITIPVMPHSPTLLKPSSTQLARLRARLQELDPRAIRLAAHLSCHDIGGDIDRSGELVRLIELRRRNPSAAVLPKYVAILEELSEVNAKAPTDQAVAS